MLYVSATICTPTQKLDSSANSASCNCAICTAMTDAEERCWYTLNPAAQPVGPYSVADLRGYAASGLVSETQVFWKEGKSSWDKLAEVSELDSVLQALQEHKATSAAATAAAGPTSPKAAAHAHSHHAHVLTGKPSDPLDVFKHEIAAVEAGTEDPVATDADVAGTGRAATPDELEFEDDDGTLYRWHHKLQKYVPAAEADAAAAGGSIEATKQQHDYDIEAMTFVAEEEIIPTLAAARAAEAAAEAATATGKDSKRPADSDGLQPEHKGKKAKPADAGASAAQTNETGTEDKAGNTQEQQQPPGWFELKVNTSVYVTGLPDDTDVDEVATYFARCGIVKLDDAGQPRIKLYRDKESGMLKGDGLVTYLKEPSVALACQILDGAPLRAVGPPLSVTPARFEMKGGQYMDKKKGAAGGGNKNKGGKGGRGGKGGKKKKPFNPVEKLERKLGWGGFDDALPPERVTVVLKGMFTTDEAAAAGPSFAAELEADVLAECSKLGKVEKVRVFAAHPQGVVTVRFKQEEPAQQCLSKMNGRYFGGNRLVAHMWDGFTSYHVKVDQKESAEEEAARLDAFAKELEQQQEVAAAAAAAADAEAAAAAAAGTAEERALAEPAAEAVAMSE